MTMNLALHSAAGSEKWDKGSPALLLCPAKGGTSVL